MKPAHIKYFDNEKYVQSVKEHVENTAVYAAENLKKVGLYNTGYVLGLLHDMGKETGKFENYIEAAAKGEAVAKGSVNHTFAAVIWLWNRYHDKDEFEILACELIAYATGAHHGLFDCVDENSVDGFAHRLNKDRDELCYDEAVRNYFEECFGEQEIDKLFKKSVSEISVLFGVIDEAFPKGEKNFAMAIAVRLILSALIDADRRDTAEFMLGINYPQVREDMSGLWGEQLDYAEGKIANFSADSEINKARAYISDKCRAFAENKSGIYRLSVPTGAGKTLSALRYSLAHAAKYNKSRIFFIIPLLSVIEQNAVVINSFIKNKEIIAEHHSNVLRTDNSVEELDDYELITESWKHPIIISTLVQLLNTLFIGKTTAIRRMNALANSIIVIDEVQSIPPYMISMLNTALNFLAVCCNCTIILCSATQPVFQKAARPIIFSEPAEMVPYNQQVWSAFKRTNIVNMRTQAGMTISEISDFSNELMEENRSLLVICNTKKEALELHNELDMINKNSEDKYELLHLSTAMCMAHRKATMEKIKDCLDKKIRIVVVSTQLVEAGVDFSFESVIRIMAGLDNVAQSAGRCNRSGDFNKICNVYIINIQNESLGKLTYIKAAQNSIEQFLFSFEKNKDKYGEMLSDKSVEYYYSKLFMDVNIRTQMDYPIKDTNIFDMLSTNKNFIHEGSDLSQRMLFQAFKTAGKEFKVFDDIATDVIVPYDATAEDIIANLMSERTGYDLVYLNEQLKRAKPYTISVFEYQLKKLADNDGLYKKDNVKRPFIIVQKEFYNSRTGLITEAKTRY